MSLRSDKLAEDSSYRNFYDQGESQMIFKGRMLGNICLINFKPVLRLLCAQKF